MSTLETIVIAIVQGLTEFLPVSSTGHMIITQSIMGIESTDFTKLFIVNIQLGTILSVVVLYWKHFFQSVNFYLKLIVAFIPAGIAGILLGDYIDELMESVEVVAISLLVGGVVFLFIDRLMRNPVSDDKPIPYKSAFIIGVFQCIAMIPGVSRSAATVIGGLTQKLSRKRAAEFSFFLAVPTMFAATVYKLYKNYDTITSDDISTLLIGNAVAFVVAMFAIKLFIGILTRYGFRIFGWYRIALGLVLLILILSGYNLQIA
ncbi:MAG: undecaprenyl-diphosphate phosphatase [Bacteroidota bacterium]